MVMSRRIKMKATVAGVEDAKKAAKAYVDRMSGDPKAIVGFGTRYALAVHETHPSQSKFLESALNEVRRGYRRDLAKKTKRLEESGHPRPLAGAITQKALQVDAKAVRRTPVDTGRLRSSHFVVEAK
jgi:hypothetical protein